MSVRIIAVVGPSGVGKDTVMAAMAAADPSLSLVRRVITRAGDVGGEQITSVSQAAFDRRAASGDFVLHWRAHGLSYGIPAQIRTDIAQGRVPLVNLSRRVLTEAQARFENLAVISLTAVPEVLAARLLARAREPEADVQDRLARAALPLPEGLTRVHEVDNSGPLDTTLAAIRTALQPERA